MRIEGKQRTGHAALRGTGHSVSGSGFQVALEGGAARAGNVAPAAPATGIDVLLALQGIPDPLQERRRQVRRGRSLLDTLDALKADLLAGRSSDGHLNQLLALTGQARERTDPGLDAILDDIELRARVELAKRGRFPAS